LRGAGITPKKKRRGKVYRRRRDRKAAFWGVPAGTIAPEPGLHTMELFKSIGEDRVRAVLIMGSNPMQTLPNRNAIRKKSCFIVVAEPFEDAQTVALADVVLPTALWVEKEGVYGQTERRYQLLEKLIPPPAEALL
jgi:nitrate reductase NapA